MFVGGRREASAGVMKLECEEGGQAGLVGVVAVSFGAHLNAISECLEGCVVEGIGVEQTALGIEDFTGDAELAGDGFARSSGVLGRAGIFVHDVDALRDFVVVARIGYVAGNLLQALREDVERAALEDRVAVFAGAVGERFEVHIWTTNFSGLLGVEVVAGQLIQDAVVWPDARRSSAASANTSSTFAARAALSGRATGTAGAAADDIAATEASGSAVAVDGAADDDATAEKQEGQGERDRERSSGIHGKNPPKTNGVVAEI